MYPKVYIKDASAFYSKKELLDGCIFWNETENGKVRIMVMQNYRVTRLQRAKDIVKNLAD